MITGEQAIKILKELKDTAQAVERYEDNIFADYRNLAESYKREIIETLVGLNIE